MRGLTVWLAPAAATFVAWFLVLGLDADDQYSVMQVAALVVVLIALGAAFGWWARRVDLLPIVLSAVVGISAACWQSWSDGPGSFAIDWVLVTVAAAILGSVVVVGSWAFKESRAKPSGA